MGSLLSDGDTRSLVTRYRLEKRYNGVCLGQRLCVDNLGKQYDEERLRYQLTQLLEDVKEIRFAVANVGQRRFQLGWCCIEFHSLAAAVAALKVLDRSYLRVRASPSILRPLLAHFPDWTEQKHEKKPQRDGAPIALHLGQPNTVDKESREFIHLVEILQQTKHRVIEKTKNALVVSMRPESSTRQGSCRKFNQTYNVSTDVLWLKNLSDSVSDQMLYKFFECFDPQVSIQRVKDPVTQQNSSHAIVIFSAKEKATLVCQDIQNHMLLSDGFVPISATLLHENVFEGFESVMDRALIEIGYEFSSLCMLTDLVLQDNISEDEIALALKIRSVLDNMQHSRGAYKKLKQEQQRALHDHVQNMVETMQGRFKILDGLGDAAEQL